MAAESSEHDVLGDDDLWTFFCGIAVVLILLVVVFDTAVHHVTHRLHHEVHEYRHMVLSAYRDKMHYLLWSSLQSELTVLGFLAFTIWLCSQTRALNFLVSIVGQDGSESRRLGGSSLPSSLSTAPWAGSAQLGVPWHVPCERKRLSSAEQLLELVEHAHMVLFIAMVLYFAFLAVVLSVLLRKFHAYEVQEFRASHGQSPSGVLQRRVSRQVDASRAYLLRRVQVMFQEELERRPAVKAAVERGTLDYTAFLEVTTQEIIERLVEFPLSTWLLVGAYFALLALGGQVLCFSMEFSFCMIVDGCYAWSTLYIAVRLLLFRHRVTHGTGTAWPLSALDRCTSAVVGPGITGFYPWSSEPSEKIAVCCMQAMLFFQVVWLAYAMCPNPLTHRAVRLNGLLGGMWVQALVRIVCLALWALFILPRQLEAFALPPFITDDEAGDLFKVLELNPSGRCPEEAVSDEVQHSSSISLMMMRRATRLRRSVARGSTVDRLLETPAGRITEEEESSPH